MIKLVRLQKAQHVLKIILPAEHKEELRQALTMSGSVDTWHEMLEWHTANGWNVPSMDDFALCSNPFLLTDEIMYDEVGNMVNCGLVYYYQNHETQCPIEQLLEHGIILLSSTTDKEGTK